MQEIAINYWALVVAALIRLVIAALWFSPVAFRESWRKIVGIDEATMNAGLPRAVAFDVVGSLAHAIVYC